MSNGIPQLEGRDWKFKSYDDDTKYLEWDAQNYTFTIAGVNQTLTGTLTVGVDDTGHDVQFFGATSGAYFLWDESADTLKLVGGAAANFQGTLTVGVDDTGYDVQFFGATSGAHLLWDESADTLKLVGGAAANFQGTLTVGVDDTGYDVQFFGATAGAHLLWDESADQLKLVGGATLDASGLITAQVGISSTAEQVTPNNDSGAASTITAGVTAVDVQAVTNDANDWIVLPSLSSVPIGHEITVACNAGGAFEVRTPASSGEKINTVNSDGTNELAMVDTEVVKFTKVSDTDGWIARSFTALGADNGALIPN